MRFMCMHKTDARAEAGLPPSPELMAGMGPLTEAMMKEGVFVAGEGLRPSSLGVRLNFIGGRRTLTKGPLTGRNELLAGFCIVQVKSIEDAIEWASRYAALIGDVEIDVRPICEMWDLGFCPKPDGLETTRFMLLQKADRNTESEAPMAPGVEAAMGALIGEMTLAGVFLAAEGLQPGSRSKRLRYGGGKLTVIDGPFAESKELIAGYAILEVPTIDEAIRWSKPFAELMGDIEIDIRPMYEHC